jgi:hypothetical protein
MPFLDVRVWCMNILDIEGPEVRSLVFVRRRGVGCTARARRIGGVPYCGERGRHLRYVVQIG